MVTLARVRTQRSWVVEKEEEEEEVYKRRQRWSFTSGDSGGLQAETVEVYKRRQRIGNSVLVTRKNLHDTVILSDNLLG